MAYQIWKNNIHLIPSLLDFAENKTDGKEKLLRVTSTRVPSGILPESYEGFLHDIKVNGHQADDKIYSNYADIRQKVSYRK